MATPEQLDAAVAAGIIGRAEADRLAAFLARYEAGGVPPVDAENIPFARGFHDIFLTIGIVLLLTGVGYGFRLFAGTFASLAVALVALALAFYFTKQRRLALPSIALSIAFGTSLGYIAGTFALELLRSGGSELVAGFAVSRVDNYASVFIAAAMTIASFGYYLYFRLPFTMGQTVVMFAITVFFLTRALMPETWTAYVTPLFFMLGLATFALAMRYDLSDPGRNTRVADTAFWLHLAAAPMIVNSTMGFIWTSDTVSPNLGDAALTLIVFAALAILAIIIDRRAILVAGLLYFGVSLSIIINRLGIGEGSVAAVTILILGAALLLLGVGWRRVRGFVISQFVPGALARRLPTVTTEPA
jgi:hypothetical protein